MNEAALLLHVVDISNPRHADHIESVDIILRDLNLQHIPEIRVLNKQDRVAMDQRAHLCRQLDGIGICAKDRSTLMPLIAKMEEKVSGKSQFG